MEDLQRSALSNLLPPVKHPPPGATTLWQDVQAGECHPLALHGPQWELEWSPWGQEEHFLQNLLLFIYFFKSNQCVVSMPYGGCQSLWLTLGLRNDWLEATQLLLWRDGASPHLGIQAAVCVRLLVVGLAQAEAACAHPPHRELLFPTGSAQSSTSLPRLQQPRAPSLLPSSLHEVLGGKGQTKAQKPHHFSPLHPLAQPFLPFIMYFNRNGPR